MGFFFMFSFCFMVLTATCDRLATSTIVKYFTSTDCDVLHSLVRTYSNFDTYFPEATCAQLNRDISRQNSRHYSQMDGYKHIMVFGKTGSGVSSTVNTLLGRNACRVGSAMHSTTEEIQMECMNEKRIQVIDMPDLVSMDREYKSDWKSYEVLSRWRRVRPDAALLVIKSDERYTAEQYEIYKKMREKLGGLISSDNLIIVFTRGKSFKKEDVQCARDDLQKVLQDARGRHIALENSASVDDKKKIVCRLLTMVDNLRNPSAPSQRMDNLRNPSAPSQRMDNLRNPFAPSQRMSNTKHNADLQVPNTQNWFFEKFRNRKVKSCSII